MSPFPSQKKDVEVATQRIFTAKLFTLVATVCECAGEFMADRFQNDVWKILARHFGQVHQRQQEHQQREEEMAQRNRLQNNRPALTIGVDKNERRKFSDRRMVQEANINDASQRIAAMDLSERQHNKSELPLDIIAPNSPASSIMTSTASIRNNTSDTKKKQKHESVITSDSERLMVHAMLRCVARVLRQKDCATALIKILSSISTILIPFLDDECYNIDIPDEKGGGGDGPLAELAMDALKNIAKVDSNAMYRSLLLLSGRGIPPKPAFSQRYDEEHRPPTQEQEQKHDKEKHDMDFTNEEDQEQRLHQAKVNGRMGSHFDELLQYIESLPE